MNFLNLKIIIFKIINVNLVSDKQKILNHKIKINAILIYLLFRIDIGIFISFAFKNNFSFKQGTNSLFNKIFFNTEIT